MSASLAQRLRLYLDIFSQRPDVSIVADHRLPPLSRRDRARLARELPPALADLSSELGGIDFVWVLAAHEAERSQYIPGYRGGRLRIPPVREFRRSTSPRARATASPGTGRPPIGRASASSSSCEARASQPAPRRRSSIGG